MKKLLATFFIIFLLITMFYLINKEYDVVTYKLEIEETNVFGYCFRTTCYGLITQNTTLIDEIVIKND